MAQLMAEIEEVVTAWQRFEINNLVAYQQIFALITTFQREISRHDDDY